MGSARTVLLLPLLVPVSPNHEDIGKRSSLVCEGPVNTLPPGMALPVDFKRSSIHACHGPQTCHQYTLWLTESKASDRSTIRLAYRGTGDLGGVRIDFSSPSPPGFNLLWTHWTTELGF